MPANDPATRKEIARIAAHTRWGKTVDRTAALQPARDGLIAKFEAQIPAEVTDLVQRANMLEHLLQAHYLRMQEAAKRAAAQRR